MPEQIIEVPFPTSYAGIDEFPRLHENLINIFNAGGNKVYQRPGIVLKGTGIGACRGQGVFLEELYQVSGTKLIKIDADGNIVKNISDDFALDIPGTAQCVVIGSFTHLVVLVKGLADGVFSWDGTTFSQINDPLFQVPAIDMDYINFRFVYIPEDGSPALYSTDTDPLDIDGLFDAETQPDANRGVINFKQRLYIMGTDTTEVFRDDGSTPFVRISGASIWTGLVSGKTLYGESFAFLGKDKDSNYGFFQMGSGNALRISNPVVDELLNTFYTVDQLKTCTAHRLQWKGQDIAIFRLPFHTLAFNGGWFFLRSIATFDEKAVLDEDFKTWRANYITHCYGEYYVGDVEGSNIGQLDEVASDYGEDNTYGFDAFVRSERETYFTTKWLNLDGLTGQAPEGQPERTIGLSVSDDGYEYGDFFFVGLGELGDYRREIFWELPGGLGDYENYMGVRIRTTAPVEFAAERFRIAI